VAEQLVAQAREKGIELVGPNGLLSQPTIVKKRQRRLTGVDQIVLSLSARGLTTGEISAHFAEVYGASLSRDGLQDHRPGIGGDERLDEPATR
jgi:hypothetical protein